MSNVTSIAKAKKRATYALTDTGNAERFAAQHRDKARYVASWKTWIVWDGSRWRHDDRGMVDLLSKETARSLDAEVQLSADDDERKRIRAHATKTESRSGRENMLVLARAELAASPDEFDTDPMLLNVANGTIDLRTGELHLHTREDMITRVLDVPYDATATCTVFDSFVSTAMADRADLVSYLQKAIGYSLTGDVREQVFFFLHGEGANGKSTLAEIVMRMLGSYAKTAAPDLLMMREQEQHATWTAELQGARFVVCQEIAEGKAWNERTLKQLTGGDSIVANRMHRDPVTFRPSHKLWVCANQKPKMRDGGLATWRRVRLIPFSVTVPAERRDKALGSKLLGEMPGILRWAVQGCLEWQAEGLEAPAEVLDATAAYRDESNHVPTFAADRLSFGQGQTVPKSALYEAYTLWCKHNRESALPRPEIQRRVLAMPGVTEGRNKTDRFLSGVSLLSFLP